MTASELSTLVQIMRERGRTEQPTVPDMRARYELVGEKFPAPAEARIEKVVAGGRPAEIVAAPEAETDRWILYFPVGEIGSESCRDRACQYVKISVSARINKKKKKKQ